MRCLLGLAALVLGIGGAQADIGVIDQVDRTPIMTAPPPGAGCGEPPAPCTWERTFGGQLEDKAYDIAALPGGDFVVAANTRSGGTGRYDAWVLRLAPDGGVRWERRFGGPDTEQLYGVVPAGEGAILAGHTRSVGQGESDLWLIRLDAAGQPLWETVTGGSANDRPRGLAPAPDGGAVAVGFTRSRTGVEEDLWAVRVGADGAILWDRTYGSERDERGLGVAALPDGGFAAVGHAEARDGRGVDAYVVRFDGTGYLVWERRLDRGHFDVATAVAAAPDRGLIVVGTTSAAPGVPDQVLILRLDAGGDILWERVIGGPRVDSAWGVVTAGDGFLVLAATQSWGAGSDDTWLLRLDDTGTVRWERLLGGALWDRAMAIQPVPGGGFVLAGTTTTKGFGYEDVWVLRIDADGRL